MKTLILTAQDLLDGSYYNLEQAGFLLDDAIVLCTQQRYSSAVVLAVFSREALGMSKWLLQLRDRTGESGSPPIRLGKGGFEDHRKKLELGITATTIRTSGGDLPKRNWSFWELQKFLNKLVDSKRKRAPNDAHNLRIRALYADPTETGGWNRPSAIGKEKCQSVLEDVAHDYARRREEWEKTRESKSYPQLPLLTWPIP